MLLEKINELESSSFSFRLYQINSTAINMHDAYEIIFVLKGTIDLKCTAFHYPLSAGDIFIVNVKELHQFTNGSDDNLILVFHFNPYFYLHIFPKLDFYLFVCNSFASAKKDSPKLLALQQMLLQLAVSIVGENPSSRKINEQVLSVITYLINNFQSFYVKQQGYHDNAFLESNDYQLQRICEIQEYIYINFKNKIRLEDLADYLHLSKYYVSHLIKNTIGLSMTDFLSLTRVEQSEILLLSTDMSIEQIAFECGFSARRYFEKHFTKWYKVSPSAYRKIHLNGAPEIYRELDLSYIQTSPAQNVIHRYMHRDHTASVFDTFFNFKVSLDGSGGPFVHYWENEINISNPYSSAFYLSYNSIKESKKELHYSAARIKNIFTLEMIKNFRPELLNSLFDLLIKADIEIIIYLRLSTIQSEAILDSLQLFFTHMKTRYGSDKIKQWHVEIENDSSARLHNTKKQDAFTQELAVLKQAMPSLTFSFVEPIKGPAYYSHNSMLLLPYVIKSCLENHTETVCLYRELCETNPKSKNKSTEPYPSSCLLTTQLEKKPLYYIWQMLSSLGDERLMQQPGIVVTKKDSGFHILIYDPNSEVSSKLRTKPITIHLELSGVCKKYVVTERYLDSERCLFQHRSALKFPPHLPREVIDSINGATSPTINFQFIDARKSAFTLSYKLNPYSAILLSFVEFD